VTELGFGGGGLPNILNVYLGLCRTRNVVQARVYAKWANKNGVTVQLRKCCYPVSGHPGPGGLCGQYYESPTHTGRSSYSLQGDRKRVTAFAQLQLNRVALFLLAHPLNCLDFYVQLLEGDAENARHKNAGNTKYGKPRLYKHVACSSVLICNRLCLH